MERLTMTSDKGGVAFAFDLDINCRPSEAQKILKLAQKLKEYEDIEEKITKKFAGCIDMKTILDSFCAFYDMQETNEDLAQCTLLTNEDVLKYRQWKEAEEQGLILRLPCRLGDIIDRIISHNETVTLMFETEIGSFRGLQHFWHGMAWNIPKEYLELPFVKIYGVVPDKITEADTIWIEVRKEAEQALARMEDNNGKHEN